MKNNQLLENLSRLGLPLMETTQDFDVNQTLAEVVKSKDTRLWEGFPVLLLNAEKDDRFNYEEVQKNLPAKNEKKAFRELLVLSLALYQNYHLSFTWSKQLKNRFSNEDKDQLAHVQNSLAHNDKFVLGRKHFDPARLTKVFKLYFEKDARKSQQQKEKYEELSLEYALSQVFSPKQKELLKKKLEGLPLTKTEKEYYSRAAKKKVVALANTELHRLAQRLMLR